MLVRAVAAANPRTVVVLEGGSAVVISEWDGAVAAIAQAWYPGMEGGHGLADVLVGVVDASGRLPFSVPRHAADLPPFSTRAETFTYDAWHGYWHLERTGTTPAYPFGFGLSYTTFVLEGARAELADGVLSVVATLANTGRRAGSDLVQVYARRAGADRPLKLAGFTRRELGPGETADASIEVSMATLAERDVSTHSMVLRPGRYELRVARHAGEEGVELDVELDLPGR